MTKQGIIYNNGRAYDAKTGLPATVARVSRESLRTAHAKTTPTSPKSAPAVTQPQLGKKSAAVHSNTIHQQTKKSTTLNRTYTKKPVTTKATPAIITKNRPRIDGIQRMPRTTATQNLAPKKQSLQVQTAPQTPRKTITQKTPVDAPARIHPIAARAHQVQAARKATKQQVPAAPITQPKPAAATPASHSVVRQALENAPKADAQPHKKSRTPHRFAGVLFGCMALVLFGGYLTYLNVPNISVRVAAAQAGINATYPGYQPDGYKLNGPVAYSDGQVRIKFAANTGSSQFVLNQKKSSWDSSALLDNYVREKSQDDYSTSQEKGLTIFNYGSNAAWVSGGIIYTIEGDAPLSPDQIRKIATSV